MPLYKNCKICRKEFKTKPSIVKKGFGKYCSQKCQRLGLRNGKEIKCFLCGKISYKNKTNLGRSKSLSITKLIFYIFFNHRKNTQFRCVLSLNENSFSFFKTIRKLHKLATSKCNYTNIHQLILVRC